MRRAAEGAVEGAARGRRLGRLAVLLVLVVPATVVGCGGDPAEAYCGEVQDQQEALSDAVGDGGPSALLDALPAFEQLRDAAPDDLRDDWELIVERLSGLQEAVEAAGVDPDTYRSDPPADLPDEDREAIEDAAGQLATPEVLRAFGAVQQQARDVCQTPLTL